MSSPAHAQYCIGPLTRCENLTSESATRWEVPFAQIQLIRMCLCAALPLYASFQAFALTNAQASLKSDGGVSEQHLFLDPRRPISVLTQDYKAKYLSVLQYAGCLLG